MGRPQKRKFKHHWPKLEVGVPEGAFRAMLLYWDELLRPMKGRYVHPDDVVRNAEVRKAIKVLLEFTGVA